MSKRKTSTTASSGTKRAAAKTAKTSTTTKARPASSKRKASSRSVSSGLNISPEERFRMIQEAAYFNAISGNSQDEIDNWLRAEQEIDSRLNM